MQMFSTLSRPAILAMAGLALSGCNSEDALPVRPSAEAETLTIPDEATVAVAAAERDCLLVVWESQQEGITDAGPQHDFDRANDAAEGGLISCATGTSASQYERALASIRAAAASDEPQAILRQMRVPLLVIDGDGNRLELGDTQQAEAAFDDIFTPDMLAALQRLELDDMTVVPDQGGFFELGAIWLSPAEPGGTPMLVTVNRQALMEAVLAQNEPQSSPQPDGQAPLRRQ